jgi:hypothetical protein
MAIEVKRRRFTVEEYDRMGAGAARCFSCFEVYRNIKV